MLALHEAAEALARRPDDRGMAAVVDTARAGDADADAVARLAGVLADSGVVRERDGLAADVASSGGPGSLSTLLCPLELRVLGARIPKVAVPGRPAGGIDTLGTVPGYRTALDSLAFQSVLDRCGYAHTLAGSDLAPLDGRLFEYRQAVGAQRVPALVVASLLAKKVAAGLSAVALDVRVGPGGNLGSEPDQARLAARLFVAAATRLGVKAVCVLSATQALRQPFVGRGEALLATAVAVEAADPPAFLTEQASDSLARHVVECRELAALAVGRRAPDGTVPGLGQILQGHLVAQGAAYGALDGRAAHIASAPRREITAPADGYLQVDLVALRDVLVGANARSLPLPGCSFPDAAGMVFLVMPGEPVFTGQPVALARGDFDAASCLGAGPEPASAPVWDGETVTA